MSDTPQYPKYPGESGPGEPTPPQQPPGGQGPPAGYNQAPPPGYNPPPPPGYAPPPAYNQPQTQQPYGGPISNHPMQSGLPNPGAYASWGARLGAYLLDGLMTFAIIVIPAVIGAILAFAGSEVDPVTDEISGVNGLGVLVMVLAFLVGIAFDVWNRAFRQGSKTQTLGKKLVGIKVVSLKHGGPIGVGAGFGRWAMQSVVPGVIPVIGSIYALYDGLSPLWDDKNQSVHDKVVNSAVVRA